MNTPRRTSSRSFSGCSAPVLAMLACCLAGVATQAYAADSCQQRASHVTISRDDWGVAHVSGDADADAVFGMMYTQAEDDFNRIETNYLTNLGRLAEAEGESALWQDLRQRLFIDPADLQADYGKSAPWLQALMQAWADGLNCYLETHPTIHPRVITRFEPWMALSFTEGSIGGDIERVPLTQLQSFYDKKPKGDFRAARNSATPQSRPQIPLTAEEQGLVFREPTGSNGFAIAPGHTQAGRALLLINPHTSFFFRSEQHVTSKEGLNVYGAATWGQFFIYQGFNEFAGWMHTSSGVDNVDEFSESISFAENGAPLYRYGKEDRPVTRKEITLSYVASGKQQTRRFTTWATHHGPIVREVEGNWIAFALMNKPVPALEQSFLRTKARDYASFVNVAERKANSSNNTLFADSKGEIAYLHPQFVPRRDARFDYRKPVDGSDPATDWQALHDLDSLPHVLSPKNGWVMNVNNWPWTAAGADSPVASKFPAYMDQAGENPRGAHAERVLNARKDFTPRTLIDAAYDSYLTAFARLVPKLIKAFDALPASDRTSDPATLKLSDPVLSLRGWDYRWSRESIQTSLAVFWGEALWREAIEPAKREGVSPWDYMADRMPPSARLTALSEAVDKLTEDFGRWQVPWGEINRFQRNDGAIVQTFYDAKPSVAVPFPSAQWGSLASFGAKRYPGTKRYYGTSGNSFVAVVEFGPTLRAWAVTAGGESGHPESKHFTDQVQRYADGNLREVYFYPAQLKDHVERTYRPGQN